MGYPRGSEWRLWDLHIHTPASFSYKGGKFKDADSQQADLWIKQIVENINKSDRSVYAINDYWTFDGYQKIKEQQGKGSIPKLEKTVFPGIELRIDSTHPSRLNLHVIFSDGITFQRLTDFKQALRISNTARSLSDEALEELGKSLPASYAKELGFSGDYKSSPGKLYELGCKAATVTKDSLIEALKTVPKEQYVVMIPYDCYGGIEEIDWKNNPCDDLFFLQLVQVVETRKQDTVDLFAGNKTEANKSFIDNFFEAIGSAKKPCVSGSDGHSIDDFLTWRKETEKKKTWIKADPTFEGFRQILFEPLQRVRIQETSPQLEFDKPYFHSVHVDKDIPLFVELVDTESPTFSKIDHIPLNSNMVCVIGGRGTGKSSLVDYIGKAYGGTGSIAGPMYAFSPDFVVRFNKDFASFDEHKASDRVRLPYVYISQSEVKQKVSDRAVGAEMRSMLGISYGVESETATPPSVLELTTKVLELESWFSEKDSEDRLINDAASINAQINQYQQLLSSITTAANREKLELFTANVERIGKAKERQRKIEALRNELGSSARRISALAIAIDKSIPPLDFSPQTAALATLDMQAVSEVQACTKENERIRTEFAEIYTGDLSTLLSNAETYRASMQKLEERLKEIGKKQADLEVAKEQRKGAAKILSENLISRKREIDKKWATVLRGRADWTSDQKSLMTKILADREISLEGQIVFDEEVFLESLKKEINLSYFKASKDVSQDQKIKETFPISNVDDYFNFMREKLHQTEEESFITGDLSLLFYDDDERSSYLYVEPRLSYKGRPIEKLSVGQRGTVYLCLKLATQAFSQPLIFDQPEDDLDNEFIITELIEIFRGIKKYRQIILVTHNANLVVNGDSEQVIVATNADGKLEYQSGSLENPTINTAVRKILEGGDDAFRNREKRYAINRSST